MKQHEETTSSEEDLIYHAKRERRLLWKLDACLITWAWLAYLIKVGTHWRSLVADSIIAH
jgi:hypothetical protein